MNREVWHKGEIAEQFTNPHTGRWATKTLRKPLPEETEDQFPKLLMTNNTAHLSGSHNAHARLSPSDSKRWTSCLASIAFQEANAHRVPKDTSSRDADEGTEAHDWAAKVLLGECTIDEVPEKGMRGADLRLHVESYVTHCLAQVAGAALTNVKDCISDADLGIDPLDQVFFVEEQLALFYQPEQTGTADFFGIVAVDGIVERFVGRDLKFGVGVLVTNLDNTQLAIYIYSAIKLLEGVYKFGPETIVDLAVFQPRHREAADERPWILTLADLAKFCEEIEYRAIQAREGANRVRAKIGAPGRDVSPEELLEAAPGVCFAPSEGDGGACRWCECKAFCPKRLEALTEDMDRPDVSAFDMLSELPDLDKADSKLPAAERIEKISGTLDDAYLVNVFAKAKGIRAWLDDVAEYLEVRVLAGEAIDGLKVVEGRPGNRDWSNEDDADKWLKNQGLKEADRYKFTLKSPTQIELLLKDKLAKVTRTKNRFDELVTRSTPKKTVAVASDKRPAVMADANALPVLDAADDFEV
jgi:hypothetical protein